MISRPKLLRIGLILPPLAALICGGWSLRARSNDHALNRDIVGKLADGSYLVPTGQSLTPAGVNVTFVGRPIDLALSPDGRVLAVMMADGIRLIDTVSNQLRGEKIAGKHNFGGIVWAPDGRTLYTTGAISGTRGKSGGAVFVTEVGADGHTTEQEPIRFALQSRIKPNAAANDADPCGLALSPDGKSLYVTLFNNATLATVDLTTYDSSTGAALTTETPVGSSPERVVVSPAGDKIYVANRGGRAPVAGDTMDREDPVVVDPESYKASSGSISVVDAARAKSDPADAVVKSIEVGLQPTALAFAPGGRRLFAANANSDSVSVIDTSMDSLVETISTSPAPGKLAESSPNGLCVAPDGATLYVTLGGDNAVAVIRLSQIAGGRLPASRIDGLIPTAWFPIAITPSSDGKTLYVANCKGIGSLGPLATFHGRSGAATPQAGPGGALGPEDYQAHSVYAVMGSLSVISVPEARSLTAQTALVARNNHFDRMAAALRAGNDPFWTRFKHVILIIKENRTYDQVFGDIALPRGHVGGDPHLVMFGERVTPNHHALAKQFGLFDNLYCSGEISADGHHWLDEAFADDYDERAMNTYPRSYPCCGTDPLSFAGNSFLWQAAVKQGLSFRNYGEYEPLPSLASHSDRDYNDLFTISPDRNEDVAHAEQILAELRNSPQGLAQLTTIWFPNDHTSGTRPGAFTPEADVADNDMAIGMIADAISHDPRYWHDEPTAIFIVEDDAQGGLDHIDGHRTVGLVISPYNRPGQINSTNYNQLNMVRTLEMMLGMKPLNQFDAAASPMRDVFEERADEVAYTVRQHNIALNLKNPPTTALRASARKWALVSAQLDFSAPDRADPELLTEVLWHATHGDETYPPKTASR